MYNWRRFFRKKQNILGLVIVGFIVLVAVAAPALAPPSDADNASPYHEIRSPFYQMPNPPTAESPLGTVPKPPIAMPGIPIGQGIAYQWDVYYTLIWGTRSALGFGLTVTLMTATIGILVGVISGYVGGAVNGVSMFITDAFLAFPPIAAIWVFQRAIFSHLVDPFGMPVELNFIQELLLRFKIDAVMVSLILFSWMPYARLINTQVQKVKQEAFVEASKALGATNRRIIWRHMLPNTLSPAVVLAARDVGGMVILASAFIFIGIGGNVAWGAIPSLIGGLLSLSRWP
jgi:peptide/nickel transport system permease protein